MKHVLILMMILLSFPLFADNTIGGSDIGSGEGSENDRPTTGIENVRDDNESYNESYDETLRYENTHTPVPIYDLQGRQVKTPQRGHIYIIGGKKVFYLNEE